MTATSESAEKSSVGEVSLSIGIARVIRSGAEGAALTIPVSRGMKLSAGDRIETEQGGHVHVKFIDAAFVSVRPVSRLVIDEYQYSPDHPENSKIRFRLEQGVARSITGRGGEAAHDQFRLNTPIAAIGIKGTDFVVQAIDNSVRVSVNSGAVVLAPLGEGCSADALGPCTTPAARTLSADMGKVMLEFQRQQIAPMLVPLNGPGSHRPDAMEPPSRAGTSDPRSDSLAQGALPPANTGTTPPPSPPSPPTLPAPTMQWAYWSWSPSWTHSDQTVSFADGTRDGSRKGSIGNENYVLLQPSADNGPLAPTQGRADFTLRDAQATYVDLASNNASSASVTSGKLSVDFSARQFSTGLDVTHSATGNIHLDYQGSVGNDGVFRAGSSGASGLVGALTGNGKEAAYGFQQDMAAGRFYGITRWGIGN